jgi:two-component system response regulator NreC
VSVYRIVLADDHVLFRQGVKSILEKDKRIEVVGEANDGIELLDLPRKVVPDMIILDISMPHLRGIEVSQEIKKISRKIKILILSMHRDKGYVHSVIEAGAEGYLLKEDADTELFAAIEKIRQDGHYLSPILSEQFAHSLFQGRHKKREDPGAEPLSTREREVLKLIAEGFSNRLIADMLSISVRTVENHRASIMRKLNAKNTAELTKYAISKGYVSSGP